MKFGMVEKRQHERIQVTLKASYQLLDPAMAKKMLAHPDYLDHPEQQIGGLINGESRDISEGGMALVGTDAFQVGHNVLVKFEVPNTQLSITSVAEVRWVQSFEEMKRPMYRAGLKFLSLKKEDVLKLGDYLKDRASKK